MAKVLVGMSGGVDSSAAALILKKSGYDVIGCTLRLFDKTDSDRPCGTSKDIEDAKSVCDNIGIEHFVFDLRELFAEKVIGSFTDSYLTGKTPNPCIECNKNIKFGMMLKKAEEMGADYVATGHYAHIEQRDGRYLLIRPKDLSKDQTYVLYTLSQYQLSHTLFPLADYDKTKIREIAREAGLINSDKADSQDICFVPSGDYAGFIESYTGRKSPSGNFIDSEGKVLGSHLGIIRYTTGQRKGLGVTFGKPVYVVGKNVSDNTVILGDEAELYKKELTATDINLISAEKLTDGMRITAKTRYSHKEQPAVIETQGEYVRVIFDEPQRAITPGQSVVFYDGNIVVGGGKII